MGILNKQKKIQVLYLNIDRTSKFKKYPIDTNFKVMIKPPSVGRSGASIEPTVTEKAIFTKGIFRTPFVIYPHGAERFMERDDEELPNFSMKTLVDFLNTGIFAWIRSAMQKKESIYILVNVIVSIIILLMCAGGFGYINF